VEPRPLHKDWEKKTRFGQFDLSLLFIHNWSYRSNFDVILVGLETVYGTPSNSLRRERTIRFKLGLAAVRQNAKTTNLSYLISWAIKL